MAGAKALPMMHHHGRQVVQEVLGARRAGGAAGTGAGGRIAAAVRLHIEALVEADVHANLLPVVPPRPPVDQSERTRKVKLSGEQGLLSPVRWDYGWMVINQTGNMMVSFPSGHCRHCSKFPRTQKFLLRFVE